MHLCRPCFTGPQAIGGRSSALTFPRRGRGRGVLSCWLALCQIHDEHGQPVHLTPHQWRHTFACRLINRDVPQEVIRVLLDHQSTQMTAHYARITDQTRPPAAGNRPQRSTSTASGSTSTPTGRWPRPSRPRPATAWPPRPSRTDTVRHGRRPARHARLDETGIAVIFETFPVQPVSPDPGSTAKPTYEPRSKRYAHEPAPRPQRG
jgi:hypothetical protein